MTMGIHDIVRLLVEAGASMMMLTNEGLTSLHVAAQEGQLEILRFLLESGQRPKSAPLFLVKGGPTQSYMHCFHGTY